MATFAAHVFVHGESGPVHFAPGDELPEWAEGLVGKHCLEPEVETDAPDFTVGGTDGGADGDQSNPEGTGGDPDDDGEGDAGESDDVDPAAKDDAPDFTAPAPRRGRSRKA